MKMLVFESSFQRALPEPCRPTNNFYRVPKVILLSHVLYSRISEVRFGTEEMCS